MAWNDDKKDVSVLKGLVLKSVEINDDKDFIDITTECGRHFQMYHDQDCCEWVRIEDVIGDISDLLGSPLLMAECVTNMDKNPSDAKKETIEFQESFTWTFYKFATQKGYVTIRWYGESNGYYSEEVTLREIQTVDDDE